MKKFIPFIFLLIVSSFGQVVSTGGGSVSDEPYDATTWNGVRGVAPSKNAVRDKIEALVLSGGSDGTGNWTASGTTNSLLPGAARVNTVFATNGVTTSALTVNDDAYDATGWNGSTNVPTKNAVRDELEILLALIPSVSDTAFGSSWNGVTTIPASKNAVYDWAHTFDTDDDGLPNKLDQSDGLTKVTSNTVGPASEGTDYLGPARIDNTAYNATSWNGDSTHAPSKDAVRDELETILATLALKEDTVALDGTDGDFWTQNGAIKQWSHNGAYLTGLNADSLATGTVPTARFPTSLTFSSLTITGAPAGALTFYDTNGVSGGKFVRVTAPDTVATNVNWILPDRLGSGSLKATLSGTNVSVGYGIGFKDYKDFLYPSRVDGAGCTINTNDYSSALWGLATYSGTADTNANYAVFRIGTVPLDLDTSVAMKLRGFSIRVSGTDTDAAEFTIALFSPASSAGYSSTDFTGFSTFINFDSGTLTSPAANDAFYFADVTLTGWAAAVTAGRPFVVGIARRNGNNDDSVTILGGTIEYGRTQ